MDASEAREHLELAARIVAASSRKLEAGGEFFITWGLACSAVDVVFTLVAGHWLSGRAGLWLYAAILGAGIIFTVARWRWYRLHRARQSLIQREYLTVLFLMIGLCSLATVTTAGIFGTWTALAALWSFGESFVLFFIGVHGNRRAQIGGALMFLSIVAASAIPTDAGWILAFGVLFGYAGFGIADLLARE